MAIGAVKAVIGLAADFLVGADGIVVSIFRIDSCIGKCTFAVFCDCCKLFTAGKARLFDRPPIDYIAISLRVLFPGQLDGFFVKSTGDGRLGKGSSYTERYGLAVIFFSVLFMY